MRHPYREAQRVAAEARYIGRGAGARRTERAEEPRRGEAPSRAGWSSILSVAPPQTDVEVCSVLSHPHYEETTEREEGTDIITGGRARDRSS